MNSLIRHLMLTTQVRTGFSPHGLICAAVAALLAAILIRRRTIARAQREFAARRSAHWLDPRLLAVGGRQGVGRVFIARYARSTMSNQRPTGESQTDHAIVSGQYAHP